MGSSRIRLAIAGLIALGLHGLLLGWAIEEEPRLKPKLLSMERIAVSLGNKPQTQPVAKKQQIEKPIPPPVKPKKIPPKPVPAKPCPVVAQPVPKPTVAEAIPPVPEIAQEPEVVLQETSTSHSPDTTAQPVQKAVPLYQVNPPPKYPRIARRRGIEGVVLLNVQVTVFGRVEDLILAQSSDSSILDKAAIKAVRNWRFDPGSVGGKPTVMWVKVPVRFQLQ